MSEYTDMVRGDLPHPWEATKIPLSIYQTKLRKVYAVVFNYHSWEDVPENIKDSNMELSIAHWMGLYRKPMSSTVDSLGYAISQLLSDIGSSIAGERGAHKHAMARVRKLMDEVQSEQGILDEQSRTAARSS